jgi:phosphoglycolate phosphatase-like HAD superfamily hydrolase
MKGILLSSEPWMRAHEEWFEQMAQDTGREDLKQWAKKPDYFDGVDEAMKTLYPNRSEEERTAKARELYFEKVVGYTRKNPLVVRKDVIDYLREQKKDYRLALLTTNTLRATAQMLEAAKAEELFDIIVCSHEDEKDDKKVVFERFFQRYSGPALFIGGDRQESFEYCKRSRVPTIFANFEGGEDIPGVRSARNLQELKIAVKESLTERVN